MISHSSVFTLLHAKILINVREETFTSRHLDCFNKYHNTYMQFCSVMIKELENTPCLDSQLNSVGHQYSSLVCLQKNLVSHDLADSWQAANLIE